jgi:hypothetical protein
VQFVVDGSKSGARIANGGAAAIGQPRKKGHLRMAQALRRSSDMRVGLAGAQLLRGRRRRAARTARGRRPRATNELEQFEVHRTAADCITAILASGRQRSRRRIRRRLRGVGRCAHDRTSRIDIVGRSPFCADQAVVRFRRRETMYPGITARRRKRSPEADRLLATARARPWRLRTDFSDFSKDFADRFLQTL